jgi:DMSO reductase anchor subunit
MTKCNFCFDNIDAGLPPACVAACPMRVLDFVEVTGNELGETSNQKLWDVPGKEHPFPLPTFSRTQPHLALILHSGMGSGLEKAISNWEEVQPQPRKIVGQGHKSTKETNFIPSWLRAFVVKDFAELSLIIFTLCAQMAVGMSVFSLLFPLSTFYLLIIGFLIGIAGLVSILHLGTPLNAWRAMNHLKKSSLSHEILMFGLFGASWLACWVLPGMGKLPLVLTGIGLVYYMSQVYRIKSVPAWNTWRTPLGFFLSAGVLGALAVNLVGHVSPFEDFANVTYLAFGAGILLAAEAGVMLSEQNPHHETARKVRGSLILLGMVGVGALAFLTGNTTSWLLAPRSLAGSASIFLIVLAEEVIGRWLFYTRLEERAL